MMARSENSLVFSRYCCILASFSKIVNFFHLVSIWRRSEFRHNIWRHKAEPVRVKSHEKHLTNSTMLDIFVYTANRCAPVPAVQHAVPDSYLAVQGSVVHYTCVDGFTSSVSSTLSTACNGINWTPAQLPGCEGAQRLLVTDDIALLLRCCCSKQKEWLSLAWTSVA